MTSLSGPRFPPKSASSPRQLVVLLHGVGADGNDLIALAPLLADTLPEAAFVAPNAPQAYDQAPFGRQWFSLADRRPEALLDGLRKVRPVVEAFFAAELDAIGLDYKDLAVIGFSQGTMTALHVVPRLAAAPAALLGYSGALLGPDLLEAETIVRPPVLLIHGEADDVVPVGALPAAVAGLERAGFGVQWSIRPGLAHGIDPEGIAMGAAFLQAAFNDRR